MEFALWYENRAGVSIAEEDVDAYLDDVADGEAFRRIDGGLDA